MALDFTVGKLTHHPSQQYFLNDTPRPTQINGWTLRTLEAEFTFSINGICLVQEECWNVAELAAQLADWLRAGLPASFRYDCVDAEETDLFTFEQHDQDFLFYAEWQLGNGRQLAQRAEVADFIQCFVSNVRERIKNDLGLDAGF